MSGDRVEQQDKVIRTADDREARTHRSSRRAVLETAEGSVGYSSKSDFLGETVSWRALLQSTGTADGEDRAAVVPKSIRIN